MNPERALGIVAPPRRIAENLVCVVGAPTSGGEQKRKLLIFIETVFDFVLQIGQPSEQFLDGEMNPAIAMVARMSSVRELRSFFVHRPWVPAIVVVVGHINTDLDTERSVMRLLETEK